MPRAHTHAAGPRGHTRPRPEVADVFREYGEAFRRGRRLPPSVLKIMRAIEVCRTAALGGHLDRCDSCGYERPAYNSCRNRHCPKCQALAKAGWLEARKADLLPVPYFHAVFTLPHELNALALCNKGIVFDLLFKAVAGTLQEFAGDPKHGLGGRLGFTGVLHTWDQRLLHHVHLHCVIPGGALSADGERWVCARKNFLFPVKAMSKVFRGKFIDYLGKRFAKGKLAFPGRPAASGTKDDFSRLVDRLWEKKWVVYIRAPFNGPGKVLDYLGRYTHRVAISNHRILKIADGMVAFRYRDRRDGDTVKTTVIPAHEFIRRFLLHMLPDGYMRIRHFGFLSSRLKKDDLPRCRKLLGLPEEMPRPTRKSTLELLVELTGIDPTKCRRCKTGRMVRVAELPEASAPMSVGSRAEPEVRDSS